MKATHLHSIEDYENECERIKKALAPLPKCKERKALTHYLHRLWKEMQDYYKYKGIRYEIRATID